MEIIDNFLDKSEFNTLKSTLLSSSFPWYFNDFILERGTKECGNYYNYQFTHTLFTTSKRSDYFYLIEPCLKKLRIRTLLRVKANLTPRADKNIIQGMHTDFDCDCLTSIFYINTNNGYTQIKNGQKIKSVENRMVIFKSSTLHSSVTCTDKKIRCVINFNYF